MTKAPATQAREKRVTFQLCIRVGLIHRVFTKGFQDIMIHKDAVARISTGTCMTTGGSGKGNPEVFFSAPKKIIQIILNVYTIVKNVTRNAPITTSHFQEISGPAQVISPVRIASLDKKPEKNGSPAKELPATINTAKTTGNFFRRPPRFRIS